MDPVGSMAGHISKLENLSKQMKQLGKSMSQSMLITKILMTLSKTYIHFYSVWDSMLDAKNFENLTSRLMVEEARLIQSTSFQTERVKIVHLQLNESREKNFQKRVNTKI